MSAEVISRTPGDSATRRVALRSMLFAPGNQRRKLERLGDFGADGIVIDLEDAVPAPAKDAARAAVRDALADLGAPLVCVRVNAVASGMTPEDVDAAVAPGLDALVLPKAGADEVAALDLLIAAAERRSGLPAGEIAVVPLIETARGVIEVERTAFASRRIAALAFGGVDLARDLDLPDLTGANGGTALAYARGRLVTAARAAGLPRPVDGPTLAVRDLAAMETDSTASRELGYQGKICIHPAQVAIANRVFAPSVEEVAFARRVVEAFAAAEAEGSATVVLDGTFVDIPVAAHAQRILAQAELFQARLERLVRRGD